jgi:hypothetical protein
MVCEDKIVDIGSAEVQSIEERLVAVIPTSALPGSGASTCGVRGHWRMSRATTSDLRKAFRIYFHRDHDMPAVAFFRQRNSRVRAVSKSSSGASFTPDSHNLADAQAGLLGGLES